MTALLHAKNGVVISDSLTTSANRSSLASAL